MRLSYQPNFIITDGVLNGIYFNNGGCAEHEIGIASIRQDFGMDDAKLGVEKRTISKKPNGIIYLKYKQSKIKRAVLMYRSYGFSNLDLNDKKAVRKYISTYGVFKTRPYKDDETSWVSCAWSDKDFGIYVAGDENVEMLDKIVQAMDNNDLMMYVGNPTPDNPFSRGGLVFMIVSTLSEDFKTMMYNEDYDAKLLCEKAQPYIDMVRSAGLKYHALSPRWKNEKKEEVMFWLNPWDQQNNYFGYVTVGDLKDWTKGKGIIVGHGFRFEKEYPEEYKKLVHNDEPVVI